MYIGIFRVLIRLIKSSLKPDFQYYHKTGCFLGVFKCQ